MIFYFSSEIYFNCEYLFQDVFVFDVGVECFVWIGSGASPDEKKNGIGYAHVSIKWIHSYSSSSVHD